MRIKKTYIYLFFIVLSAFQSTAGQNEITDKNTQDIFRQSDWRIENLMKQAQELFEAYDKADYVKFVELSHPQIYKKKGIAKFFDEVELVIFSRSVGYEPLPSTVETPNELFEIDKRLFAVVPYKLEAVGKVRKDKSLALGSMVGISEDGGKSWKFAKGVAFNEAFQDVASMIPIPNPIEKRFVNDIEQ